MTQSRVWNTIQEMQSGNPTSKSLGITVQAMVTTPGGPEAMQQGLLTVMKMNNPEYIKKAMELELITGPEDLITEVESLATIAAARARKDKDQEREGNQARLKQQGILERHIRRVVYYEETDSNVEDSSQNFFIPCLRSAPVCRPTSLWVTRGRPLSVSSDP